MHRRAERSRLEPIAPVEAGVRERLGISGGLEMREDGRVLQHVS
jgi:hypothetical protein